MIEFDQPEEALNLLRPLEAAARASGTLNYLIESLVIQAVVR